MRRLVRRLKKDAIAGARCDSHPRIAQPFSDGSRRSKVMISRDLGRQNSGWPTDMDLIPAGSRSREMPDDSKCRIPCSVDEARDRPKAAHRHRTDEEETGNGALEIGGEERFVFD